MEFQDASTAWVASMFDPTQAYLYVIVLPTLIMFALGFRSQAMMYVVGAVAFMAFMGTL